MYKFPERLKELMAEENLSQNKLAKMLNVSQSEIARWLSYEHKPSVDCLIALANHFKCSLDYLVGLVD